MSPTLYEQINGFLAQYDFYMTRQEGQELLTLRIDVFTSTIQSVGQPTRMLFSFHMQEHKGLCIHEFHKWSKLSVHYQIIIRRLSVRSGFDYKSPVLYLNNPVFITTRYGFIINRQNMDGVISTQDWGYHLYYKKLVKPTMWFNVTGMIYFIFDYS